jgi:2-aminoadipate transaminase
MHSFDFAFSTKAERTKEPPISQLMRLAVEGKDLISLAAGLVDYESLPAEESHIILGGILEDRKKAPLALQYGTNEGLLSLREHILARWHKIEGIDPSFSGLSPGNVAITTGSQQLLYLMAEALLDPGDIVIIGAPSYFVFMGVLQSAGAQTLSVPLDSHGIKTDILAEKLEGLKKEGRLSRLKMIYVASYYQNPTGISLIPQRRQELIDVVRRLQGEQPILILEDAAYRELRYEGEETPSIKALDEGNTLVAMAGTFSKAFAPGIRTGFAFLPEPLVHPILNLKANQDFGSANINQHLVLSALESGLYDAHLKALRARYKKKKDAMLEALEENLSDHVQWEVPGGGLYVWVSFPAGIETGPASLLFQKAKEKGMLYVPGEFSYGPDVEPPPKKHIRLSFGSPTLEEIKEGVRRLSLALDEVLGKSKARKKAAVAEKS